MSEAIPVLFPLINPNEPEALLAGLHVAEGQQVSPGDLLCTLETTKSTAEVAAESGGFVVGLRYAEGDTVQAGETFCFIAASSDWQPPEIETPPAEDETSAEVPQGLRITQPALALAQQHNLDLSQLPTGPMVTVSVVQSYVSGIVEKTGVTDFDPEAIIIYGGGGHGKALIDLVRALDRYRIVGVVDDGLRKGDTVMDLPVLGGGEVLPELHQQGIGQAINAVGGIGNVMSRVKVFEKLAAARFVCPPVAHPTAVIEASAALTPGVQVFPLAYVGTDVQIGFGGIVNTGAIISHDCVLGDYVNVAPGAILAGAVKVGEGVLIGMGVTVNLNVNIGARARIGNSATVKSDLPEGGVVRAGTIWPKESKSKPSK